MTISCPSASAARNTCPLPIATRRTPGWDSTRLSPPPVPPGWSAPERPPGSHTDPAWRPADNGSAPCRTPVCPDAVSVARTARRPAVQPVSVEDDNAARRRIRRACPARRPDRPDPRRPRPPRRPGDAAWPSGCLPVGQRRSAGHPRGGPPAWRSPCPARHRRPARRRTGPGRQQHRSGVALAVVDKGCVDVDAVAHAQPASQRPEIGDGHIQGAHSCWQCKLRRRRRRRPAGWPSRCAGRMISPASISADSTAPSNACAASGSRLARAPRPREPAVAAGAIRPAACPPPGPRPRPVVRQRARWPPPARLALSDMFAHRPGRGQGRCQRQPVGAKTAPRPHQQGFHRVQLLIHMPLPCSTGVAVHCNAASSRSQRCAAPAGTRAARQPASRRRRCANLRPTRGQGAAPDLFPHAAAVFMDFKIQLQARVRRQPRGRHKSGRRAKPDLKMLPTVRRAPTASICATIARRPPFPTAKPVQATHADQQGRVAARTANV